MLFSRPPSTGWGRVGLCFTTFDIELRKYPIWHFYAEVPIDRSICVEKFGVGYAQIRPLAGNRAVTGFMLGDAREIPIELLTS